jgi:hypothetical protein
MTKIWDAGTGALYTTIKKWLSDAVILSNGVHIVFLSYDNALILWDRRQEGILCTDHTLTEDDNVRVFPYSHRTRILGFVSIHYNYSDHANVVCCWAIEPVHKDGPRMVPIACGTIPLESNVTRATHTGSMEKGDLRLVIELEKGRRFFASWNDSTLSSAQPQELHFVEGHKKSLGNNVSGSLSTKQSRVRTFKNEAWILDPHYKKVLWLPREILMGGYSTRCISWYGQKLAVGGRNGRLALVDFSNVNETRTRVSVFYV